MSISSSDLASGRAEAALTLPDRISIDRPSAALSDAGGGISDAAPPEIGSGIPARIERFSGLEGTFASRAIEDDQAIVKVQAGQDLKETDRIRVTAGESPYLGAWEVQEVAEGAWAIYRVALVRRVR